AHLLGDELQRAAQARAFEEAERAVERRRRCGLAAQAPLEMRENRLPGLLAGSQLLDGSGGQRAQVLGGAGERREGVAARLVGKRDREVAAGGERLDERPLGAGQVFEPVGEHRAAVPGVELAGDAAGRVAALELAVPEPEPVELL